MPKKDVHYHNDGSIWSKGSLEGTRMAGYCVWFRKDGPKCVPAISKTENQLANG